ncbi:hypothetical protein [Planobacterium oryzisoli]|uniref:Uncharacterized protein n=1 Tax=Planobacterium oryzisoli TaxID=2771435 RepID=A0A930YVE1_9FLAO|nr:hypothetical protein [Planobacterium oryzisoli]MBF5027089.1 hypothetical protein [Planobacterium oryzisoli]
METNYFRGESPDKGWGFILALAAMLLFAVMGVGVDADELLQSKENHIDIPGWYFYLIFGVDLLIILSIVLIYLYRKSGVLLFPLGTALHFYFHLYYLDTFLYSDVTSLFLFVGIGLLVILPKWQFFKGL